MPKPYAEQEAADARNLSYGVWLRLAHPELDGRTCADCIRYVWDDKPDRLGTRQVLRGDGSPTERPPGVATPCHLCPKVPCGSVPPGVQPTPDHAIELSPRNAQAYWHYLECKAVGHFPDDPTVRRNAALIRSVEDDLQRQSADILPLVLALVRPR